MLGRYEAVCSCCKGIGRNTLFFFFFQAEDGIRDVAVTGVQTCALPILVPTAYSLLALKHARGISQQDLVHLRIRRGVEMLYDRICPEGGWNAGNGVVYEIGRASCRERV